ncbi:Suppressor of the cold-sensitive snRNP bioproteinsis mutant brr1-1, partial [Perkinsus olseni]
MRAIHKDSLSKSISDQHSVDMMSLESSIRFLRASVGLPSELMFMQSTLLLSLAVLLLSVHLCNSDAPTHTLVRISHRGNPVDIRHVPLMMAQVAAFGERSRPLSQGDHETEQCLTEDGAVEDLTLAGVQIVHSDECSASYKQISEYLKKAEGELGIDFDCEPDYSLTFTPICGPTTTRRPRPPPTTTTTTTTPAPTPLPCTGGNPLLG